MIIAVSARIFLPWAPYTLSESVRRKAHDSGLLTADPFLRATIREASMKGILEDRAIRLGEYIIEHQSTVRDTAAVFGVSKSTVHKDITTLLPKLNAGLYKEVRAVLDVNKEERHLRGGEATKHKYELLKELRMKK